jgi:hypothetical protein
MATLLTLETEIAEVVDDDSISITSKINDSISFIAAGIRMPDGTTSPPLPDLYEIATVSTTVNASADLPDNYQRNVFYIADSSGDRILPASGGTYYDFMLFLNRIEKKNLSEVGTVYRVVVKGKKLYYQGIPSVAEDVTIHYYKKPTELALAGSEVDGIPDHLQVRLIKHDVCRNIFGTSLEDGENSKKMAFTHHTNRFYEAMIELVDFIGVDAEPIYYGSSDSFEDGGCCD